MDVWIRVLAFVLLLGFGTANIVCFKAIKNQGKIIIKSRLRHKTNSTEIIYVNVGLILIAICLYYKYFLFIPAIFLFCSFIIMSTKIVSGITGEGIVVGTSLLEWQEVKGYKIINDDINTITIKLRANRKQYVLICDKTDKKQIEALLLEHSVTKTETINN